MDNSQCRMEPEPSIQEGLGHDTKGWMQGLGVSLGGFSSWGWGGVRPPFSH